MTTNSVLVQPTTYSNILYKIKPIIFKHQKSQFVQALIYVYMHTYILNIYAMYVCMYVFNIYTYVYVFVCMYVACKFHKLCV